MSEKKENEQPVEMPTKYKCIKLFLLEEKERIIKLREDLITAKENLQKIMTQISMELGEDYYLEDDTQIDDFDYFPETYTEADDYVEDSPDTDYQKCYDQSKKRKRNTNK